MDRLDPELLIARLTADQHGLARHDQFVMAGLTRHQISHRVGRGLLVRVHDLVYRHAAVAATWESELLAACWAGGPRGAASRRSAAALHDLPGRDTGVVEITCPRWRRAQHEGLVVHESVALDPIDLTSVDGIPCTTVERTLLDLGSVRGARTVLMAFDEAVRRGLTDWWRVDATLVRLARSGRPGVRKLRWALADRAPDGPVPESPAETMLGTILSDAGIAAVPQFNVLDGRGFFVARVDWALVPFRIAIEYDSDRHHLTPKELEADSARRNRLLREGWVTVSVRASDLREGGRTLVSTLHDLVRSRFGVSSADQISTADARIG